MLKLMHNALSFLPVSSHSMKLALMAAVQLRAVASVYAVNYPADESGLIEGPERIVKPVAFEKFSLPVLT